MIRFEWNDAKAAANLQKHDIAFEDAQSVFDDPLARFAADPDHSNMEDRELIAGHSRSGKLLLVSYARGRKVIRIISARELTRKERAAYEEENES